MRNPDERQIALECLRLATIDMHADPTAVVERAEAYFAFVADDDSKSKLEAVREVIA